MPDEAQVYDRINVLVEQEHELRERHRRDGLSEDDLDRLHGIEEQLDQLWDLLRQRRARREFGEDPGGARERGPETVERYEQ
jgi:uncharacterized protein DUF2630